MTDWQDLDQAFTLPATVPEDSAWRTQYEHLLLRTRTELSHLEVSTPDILLIERYLTGYILMRVREDLPLADDQGFRGAAEAKDVNSHWLGLAREVRGLIEDARKRSAPDLVNKKVIEEAVMAVLVKIEDPATRQALMSQFSSEFDRIGV